MQVFKRAAGVVYISECVQVAVPLKGSDPPVSAKPNNAAVLKGEL